MDVGRAVWSVGHNFISLLFISTVGCWRPVNGGIWEVGVGVDVNVDADGGL